MPLSRSQMLAVARALHGLAILALLGALLIAVQATPAAAAVNNPGFESFSALPNCGNAPITHRAPLALNWSATLDGDPDYYHLNSGSIECLRYSPAPRTGCGHAGIMVGAPGNGAYREYIQAPIGNLNAGDKVMLRYFVRRVLGTGPTKLGVHLALGPVGLAAALPADAEVSIGATGSQYTGVEVAVTAAVSGAYTLVIGCFEPDPVASPSYFFIDDVHMALCASQALTSQPATQVRCTSEMATFTTSATGPSGFSFQWQRFSGSTWSNVINTARVSGATTNTLQITKVSVSDYSLYRCQLKSACGSLTTTTVGLFSSGPPVAVYRFSSPIRGADLSGNNLTGTLGEVETGSTETCGGYLHFRPDNNADEFTVPHSPTLDILGGMTGMAWIRPAGPHSANDTGGCPQGTIFTKGGSSWFQVGQNNNQLEFQNEGSGSEIAVVPVTLPINEWSHVAFVRSNDTHTIRFFHNGLFKGSGTLANAPGSNTDPLMVGNHGFGNNPDFCEFNGDMDEVTIIARALTDSEVQRAASCSCMPRPPQGYPMPRTFPVDRQPVTGPPLVLREPAPSPMRDRTTFVLDLDRPRSLRLDIFDVAGRHVRTVSPGTGTVGTNTVVWDGRDDRRMSVGSGVYLYRVTAGDVTAWSRIVVIR